MKTTGPLLTGKNHNTVLPGKKKIGYQICSTLPQENKNMGALNEIWRGIDS